MLKIFFLVHKSIIYEKNGLVKYSQIYIYIYKPYFWAQDYGYFLKINIYCPFHELLSISLIIFHCIEKVWGRRCTISKHSSSIFQWLQKWFDFVLSHSPHPRLLFYPDTCPQKISLIDLLATLVLLLKLSLFDDNFYYKYCKENGKMHHDCISFDATSSRIKAHM